MGNISQKLKTEFRLPDINGERCVHAFIEQSSCSACVDVCPQNAWILDDESLGLNTESCDGCGLCVPACTEGAISQTRECVIREEDNKKILLLGCEITGLKQANCHCIHAVSENDLLKLYRDGVHHIHVARGDCQQCPRGAPNNTEALFKRVSNINKMLRHRHLAPIHYNELATDRWTQLWKTPEKAAPGPQMSRRNFFRRAIKQSVDMVLHQSNFDQNDFAPPGKILPEVKADDHGYDSKIDNDAIYPAVPHIMAAKCDGCDACSRACPHQAIQFVQDENASCYLMDASACTACNICVDICEQDAIEVNRWAFQKAKTIPLENTTCHSCGAAFHYPFEHEAQTDTRRTLCNICSKIDHQKNLFQVLD